MGSIILTSHGVDERASGYLSDYLCCPVAFKDLMPMDDLDLYEKVYEVGGSQMYPNSIFVSGLNRYETCQKVLNLIAGG